MEVAETLQTELEKAEEQEQVSEEERTDKGSGNIGDGGTTGKTNKRRRTNKVIPNLDKVKKRVFKPKYEEKQDCGEIVKEGEGMD